MILTSPPAGAISRGLAWADVWLEGAPDGPRTVTLSIGTTVLATATGTSNHFTLPWDSTKVANGPHVLVAVSATRRPHRLGTRDVNVQNATATPAASGLPARGSTAGASR